MANALLAAGVIESSGHDSLTMYQGSGTRDNPLFTSSSTALLGIFTPFFSYCIPVINAPGNTVATPEGQCRIVWNISGQCIAQGGFSDTIYWVYIE